MSMSNLAEAGDRDRRDSGRLRFTIKVKLTWGRCSGVGYSLDISEAGMFIETKARLALDTDVRLEFTMIRDGVACPVVAHGRVARTVTSVKGKEGDSAFNGLGIAIERFEQGKKPFQDVARGEVAEKKERAVEAASRDRSQGIDRRRAPRVPVGIPVLWDKQDPPKRGGQIGNLSESGAFVIGAEETAPIGAKIYVEFELPMSGRMMTVRGLARVVREVPLEKGKPFGMGIEFNASTTDVDVLRKFIARRQRAARSPISRRPPPRKPKKEKESATINLQMEWGQVSSGFVWVAGAMLVGGVVVIQVLKLVLGVFA